MSPLGFDVAGPFLTVWLDARARSWNLRVLPIKGVVFNEQGSRRAKLSYDVDVLVHPADHAELVLRLSEEGWRPTHDEHALLATEPHSDTLLHEFWPCTIDVHRRWPGFLATPTDAFEAIWRERTQLPMLDRPIAVPSFRSAVLISALNETRNRPRSELARALEECARRASAEFGDRAAAELAEIARRTGAEQTAAGLLEMLGADPVPRVESPELHEWELAVSAKGNSTASWALRIREARWFERPALVIDALALSPGRIRALRPGATRGELIRVWFGRLRKGLGDVKVARTSLRETRSQRSSTE